MIHTFLSEAPFGASVICASLIPVRIAYFSADVLSFSDYYPFGSQMPGRSGNQGDYRFGFRGIAAGAGLGLLGFETGPGVVITVAAGAIVGGYYGEEGVEKVYEYIMGNDENKQTNSNE